VAASSLFTAQDQEGNNTITQYAFWDGGTGGGHFTVNGVTQASGKWIYVNASDLGSVEYVGGSAAGSENLYVAAKDGQIWGSYAGLTATTAAPVLANKAPEVTTYDQTVGVNEWSQAYWFMDYADPDGDEITQFRFWDGGTGASSGYFSTPDNAHHAAGTAITVDAANLEDVRFVGGEEAGTETLWVQAYDGQTWSKWMPFDITTDPLLYA
jgi:hypothetical protein